ncbi:MAG: hypothetical protein J0M19_10780, partial [Sphingomonadales bacterium]|nr:hypothetical protein [Sphingomonadales bacterium]
CSHMKYAFFILLGALVLAIFSSSGKKPASSSMPAQLISIPADAASPAPPTQIAPPPAEARSQQTAKSEAIELYVRGKRVPFRADPRQDGQIIDRLNEGFLVYEVDRQDRWVRVKHSISQKVGWVLASRLSKNKPYEQATNPTKKEKGLSEAAIVAMLIQRSVAEYRLSRPCACPYNTDRSGRSCGKRSAWSRPGGATPLCYPTDVTKEMIASFHP